MFRSLKALFDAGIARLTSHEASIDDAPLAVAAACSRSALGDQTVDANEATGGDQRHCADLQTRGRPT